MGNLFLVLFFDFGLYFFHNTKNLLKKSSGPYFYLPKLESHLEARLWNDVFNWSEKFLGVSNVIRATVLIETILAAFEMDEILYELRNHSSGLNCGRWDYIFSIIKKFINYPDFVMGDRSSVGMTAPMMDAYVKLLIKTCHKRGVHAMGGMAAQIPNRDKNAHEEALKKVSEDKLREVTYGHDGTWVAHPGLIPVTLEVFNRFMKGPNQIEKLRDDVTVSEKDLLNIPKGGKITPQGLKMNCEISLLYLEAWLRGNGCIPLHNLMEDLATAEISRSQLYQWIKHRSKLIDGTEITKDFVVRNLKEICEKFVKESSEEEQRSSLKLAYDLIVDLLDGPFMDFMSLKAYPYLVKKKSKL